MWFPPGPVKINPQNTVGHYEDISIYFKHTLCNHTIAVPIANLYSKHKRTLCDRAINNNYDNHCVVGILGRYLSILETEHTKTCLRLQLDIKSGRLEQGFS